MTVSMVTQIAIEPKILVIGIEQDSLARRLIGEATHIGVAVMPEGDSSAVRKLSHPGPIEFAGGQVHGVEVLQDEATGLLIPVTALGWLGLSLERVVDFDSHAAVFASVISATELVEIGPDTRAFSLATTRMNYGG
jgi:flavin reductase (DIM6/NTAB) family NADH-FMN oxidoreductase RutF